MKEGDGVRVRIPCCQQFRRLCKEHTLLVPSSCTPSFPAIEDRTRDLFVPRAFKTSSEHVFLHEFHRNPIMTRWKLGDAHMRQRQRVDVHLAAADGKRSRSVSGRRDRRHVSKIPKSQSERSGKEGESSLSGWRSITGNEENRE